MKSILLLSFLHRPRALAAAALFALARASSKPPSLQDPALAAPLLLPLDGTWALSSGALSITASVPGDSVTDLQAAGLSGDPLYGNNPRGAAPLWDRAWTYSLQFDAPPPALGGAAYLVFDGAKMVADVFLNGAALGDARSQFLRYVIPLPPALLRAQGNALAVAFAPAADARNVEGRYMACSGGWDWAPATEVLTPPCPAARHGRAHRRRARHLLRRRVPHGAAR